MVQDQAEQRVLRKYPWGLPETRHQNFCQLSDVSWRANS